MPAQAVTHTDWVLLPENRAGRVAVEAVADGISSSGGSLNPLFLHGPAGTGKTHLVRWLVAEATRCNPALLVAALSGSELAAQVRRPDESDPDVADDLTAARRADLLILEDLQHLASRSADLVAGLIDRLLARCKQVVCTASTGPAHLTELPVRLTNRLAGGVVVGLETFAPGSRVIFLTERARQRGMNVGIDILSWLAGQIPGSARQLEGALNRLQELIRLHGGAISSEIVREHFADGPMRSITLERIARQVGQYYRVTPRQLCARSRARGALLPRQVGMYLARQLTDLSLVQIGAFFGGRDHTTVLHACRKVEQGLDTDTGLAGAVRTLSADLA
jgi:chromosomal replication initiator protein